MEGFIKLHRKILNWQWYDDINVKTVFLHLLLTANYEDKNWHGITIKRGQRVISYQKLAEECSISQQAVRTAILKLKSTSEITSKSTNKYTLVTIVTYEKYQINEKKSTSKSTSNATNEQQTNNNNIRNKEYKEERNSFSQINKEKFYLIDNNEDYNNVYEN